MGTFIMSTERDSTQRQTVPDRAMKRAFLESCGLNINQRVPVASRSATGSIWERMFRLMSCAHLFKEPTYPLCLPLRDKLATGPEDSSATGQSLRFPGVAHAPYEPRRMGAAICYAHTRARRSSIAARQAPPSSPSSHNSRSSESAPRIRSIAADARLTTAGGGLISCAATHGSTFSV